jgi:histidine triad (HIT) family protein
MLSCTFCRIVRKETESPLVFEDETCVVFLDHRPLFPGHCLVVPRGHHETLLDIPAELIAPLFTNVRRAARAVQEAVSAEGSFVAINNRISQSVPHCHVHVVPRRKGDGLKGFFWPRKRYGDPQEMLAVQAAIREAIEQDIKKTRGE